MEWLSGARDSHDLVRDLLHGRRPLETLVDLNGVVEGVVLVLGRRLYLCIFILVGAKIVI